MGIIKSLPALERPREKALRYGLDTLSDHELLAILIGSGYKGENVIELAVHLLSNYGGLLNLSNIPFNELKKNKGIKNAKALNLAAIFEFHKRLSFKLIEDNKEKIDAEYLYNKYYPMIGKSLQEQVIIVVLSKFKNVIHESILFKGSEKGVSYSFGEIVQKIMAYGGKYFYLIHNHPNGDCKPSQQDIIATGYLLTKSKEMNYPMLDHIIIATNGYYSFKKNEKNLDFLLNYIYNLCYITHVVASLATTA